MILSIFLLLLGMLFLIFGANYFVDGASSLAKRLRIPSIIIGLTLVSMGTSAPEASVSIISAIDGKSDLSYGNIVGSNIFNALVVLGLSALLVPIVVSKGNLKIDIPFLLIVSGVLFLFGYVITKGRLDIFEGIILLILFVLYLSFLFFQAKKVPEPPLENPSEIKMFKILIFIILGLTGIIGGGKLVVVYASDIALRLGMSEILVGLTIVAVGTSLPELVTSVVAARKKENDIAIGNVIGSNIFNIVFILGITSVISPISVASNTIIDGIIMLAITIYLLIFGFIFKKYGKYQGLFLMAMYAGYLTYIIIRN